MPLSPGQRPAGGCEGVTEAKGTWSGEDRIHVLVIGFSQVLKPQNFRAGRGSGRPHLPSYLVDEAAEALGAHPTPVRSQGRPGLQSLTSSSRTALLKHVGSALGTRTGPAEVWAAHLLSQTGGSFTSTGKLSTKASGTSFNPSQDGRGSGPPLLQRFPTVPLLPQ